MSWWNKQAKADLQFANDEIRRLENNLQKLSQEFADYQLSDYRPWKERVETTIATEQLVNNLYLQITSLTRANSSLKQTLASTEWYIEINNLRTQLTHYQQLYAKLLVKLQNISETPDLSE